MLNLNKLSRLAQRLDDVNTPSGFFVEYGWGGRVIDPKTWQPHERPSMAPRYGDMREQRKRLREMRLSAAASGVRAPGP